MLAVQIQRTGGPEVLEVVDLPEPAPGPGEILIRQEAVGLNFIDTYQQAVMQSCGPSPPRGR